MRTGSSFRLGSLFLILPVCREIVQRQPGIRVAFSVLIGKKFGSNANSVYFLPIMVYALHEVIRVNLISAADRAAKRGAAERKMRLRGGICHKLQVDVTCSSNDIEYYA